MDSWYTCSAEFLAIVCIEQQDKILLARLSWIILPISYLWKYKVSQKWLT
jgi:hypothetical protein